MTRKRVHFVVGSALLGVLSFGTAPAQDEGTSIAPPPVGFSYRIDTIAGTVERGDGGPADQAWLAYPRGVAVDGAGNLFVADRRNHRIRRVNPGGTITTVAGTGEEGFSGDGGPADQARLDFPSGVAVDGAGNLFIADTVNDRIRRVDPAGTITTVAGTGEEGFSGDGGPAEQARLDFPRGVAVDGSGNLFIADRANHRIRRVDPAGTITTIAGTGERGYSGDGGPADQARLDSPVGVAVDGAGNLFIADTFNQRIRRVDPAGIITTIAGTGGFGFSGDGGPADQARLAFPVGVAVDGAGNLFIADEGNHRIRRVDPAGTITTIAGTGGFGFSGDGGPADQARLDSPVGVAVDGAGNLFIADTLNHRIRRVDPAGSITTVAGTAERGDGGPAEQARLYFPSGVAVDGAGNLFVADQDNQRIRRVDRTGTITTVAGTGERGFSGDGGPADQARLYFPSGVAVDVAGNLFIADRRNHRIRRVDPGGTSTTVAGTGEEGFSGDGGPADQARLYFPTGVAMDVAGNLFIADWGNNRIRRVDRAGTITTVAGTGERGFSGDGGPADQARLDFPSGVAVDVAGNLFIADRFNDRIRKVDRAGTITTVAGTGRRGFRGDGGPADQARLDFPSGVAVDVAGNLFIADEGNQRIRRVDRAGTITAVAGTGEQDFSGDGGPAEQARLASPAGVAVDGAGNLFIADTVNDRIRVLTPALDFAHFANGASVTSDLVLVNVEAATIHPTLYFYDQAGAALDAESVVDVSRDLETTADQGLTVATGIEPLGERTISTHGEGDLVTGSVTVLSSGRGGGVLRFDLPEIGVAGVRSSPPVRDAIFPVRRQAGGINTGAAIRNLGLEAMTATCHLMQDGEVLETTPIPLAASGKVSRFIDEWFPETETSDFVGSVRCTAPEGRLFTGVALELDAGNRIFTTLPVVPVPPPGAEGQAATLDFAHFGNGAAITSDLVLVNVSTRPVRPALYFYDRAGAALDAESVVDVTGDLQVQEDGALSVQTEMAPLGELTIPTHGRGALVTGSVKVVAEGPIGGVLRFTLPEIGVAGVGASSPVRDTIFPVRRQTGGIRTGAALHNLGGTGVEVTCRLMQAGTVLEEAGIPLAANGQTSWFIEELFVRTETSDFVGSVRCTAPEGELFTGVALELDAGNRIFTTLPVVPVETMTFQE